jgi:uncharacterized membrane protein YfcA
MDIGTIGLIALAGFLGGLINAVVGSGTLLVYPILLAAGLSPITANGTNTTGLSLGNLAAAWAYRRHLVGRWRQLAPAFVLAVIGSAGGVLLVLSFPERVFVTLVPWLILGSAALVALQPLLSRRLGASTVKKQHPVALNTSVGVCSIYAGYFGAGQGVIYMAILGAFYDNNTQASNAAKNVLAGVGNVTAALVFIIAGRVYWPGVAIVMPLAIIGGVVGAKLAQRMSTSLLRWAVVGVGVVASVALLVTR